jgi:hypothetical protein
MTDAPITLPLLRLGADERTAQALAAGAGTAIARGTRVVVAVVPAELWS